MSPLSCFRLCLRVCNVLHKQIGCVFVTGSVRMELWDVGRKRWDQEQEWRQRQPQTQRSAGKYGLLPEQMQSPLGNSSKPLENKERREGTHNVRITGEVFIRDR